MKQSYFGDVNLIKIRTQNSLSLLLLLFNLTMPIPIMTWVFGLFSNELLDFNSSLLKLFRCPFCTSTKKGVKYKILEAFEV